MRLPAWPAASIRARPAREGAFGHSEPVPITCIRPHGDELRSSGPVRLGRQGRERAGPRGRGVPQAPDHPAVRDGGASDGADIHRQDRPGKPSLLRH